MGEIYLLHAGSELIENAIDKSKFKKDIIMINPTINSIFLRGLRRVHIQSNIKSKRIWVDYILNKVNIKNSKENTMIIFDAPIWIENISYIRKKYNNIKIIFWFWNIIKEKTPLAEIKDNCDKVYVFDESEAKKHRLDYHPQFYWIKEQPTELLENDIFFIGRNKGRLSTIESIYMECLSKDFKVNFYVVKDKKNDVSELLDLKNKGLKYSEVLKEIIKSKCILDINQNGQAGLTIRALEALFLKKKLITNNRDLIKYDFYHKENILIIDENNIEIERDFLNSEFVEIDDNIVEKYTTDSWIKELIGESSSPK